MINEKNIPIIKKQLDHELDLAFKYIDNKIANLYSGVVGFFINPIVKFFYNFIARDQVVKRARKQLAVIIDCASKYNGKNLDKIIDENFERYLKTEEIYMRGNRRHPKFKEVIEIEREIFKGRLMPILKLLEGKGKNYGELTLSVFPKRKDAEKHVWKQLEYAEQLIKLAKKERDLIRIPSMIRNEVFAILDSGYIFAKKTLKEQLDEMYGPE